MWFVIYQSENDPEWESGIVFDRAFANTEVAAHGMPNILDEYKPVGIYYINHHETPSSFELDPADERTRLVIANERFDAKGVYEDKAGKYVVVKYQDNLECDNS